jgi:hypothetical protein
MRLLVGERASHAIRKRQCPAHFILKCRWGRKLAANYKNLVIFNLNAEGYRRQHALCYLTNNYR